MQKNFEKIGIVFNPEIEETIELAQKIKAKIQNAKVFSIDEMDENVDLSIAIGGDGTFLKASRFYCATSTPVIGFNVGRLGYLAQAHPEEIDSVIKKLNSGDYKIENRLMLKTKEGIALNDVVVKGKNCARTATFNLFVNEKCLCSYVADGLIVATPTGSTAYSLSAGGPIISPTIDCFLVIPICPHTLNTRPIVIPTTEKITIKSAEKEESLNVTLDGQVDYSTTSEVLIEKNEKPAKLLILDKQKDKFYDILKEKLHWSIAPKK